MGAHGELGLVVHGERPRQLVEAASSGNLDQALAAVPPETRDAVANAAREGFLAGLNDVLTLGALVSLAGAALAAWLVRERDIEREPVEPQALAPLSSSLAERA